MPKKKTTDEFINQAISIHGNLYDYSLVCYINNRSKVKIICKEHGVFTQSPADHIQSKAKCPSCQSTTHTTSSFTTKANKIHNQKYDYKKVNYINNITKIIIICSRHGEFLQRPTDHFKGSGCPLCANEKISKDFTKTTKLFIEQSIKIHGYIYDYKNVNYKSAHDKVIIICAKHGEFLQKPCEHLKGYGCRRCVHYVSKGEKAWLDEIGILEKFRQYNIKLPSGKNFKADGYDPDTNTVYLYHGYFWHGHPDHFNPEDFHPILKIKYEEVYEKTLLIEQQIKNVGYNLEVKWGY